MSWFAQPWGLLGLLGVPAVVLLHLYRRRQTRVPVAALFLWEDAQRSESQGRKRQPLRRTPSFWLEVLGALLAGLLLGGFDPLAGQDAVHLVAVLDDSASMSHAPRRQAAIEELEKRFSEEGRRVRVSLVRSGVRPRLLCGPAALLPDARRALEDWQPSAPGHALDSALDLARELANGGEILLLTDRAPDPERTLRSDLYWVAVGEPASNFSLSEARRSRDVDGERLAVTVRHDGDAEATTTLRVLAGEQELAARAWTMEANGERRIEVELPAGTPRLTVMLGDDALAVDNRATLLPPVDRTVRVAVGLEDDSSENLRIADLVEALPQTVATTDLSRADLVVAHQAAASPAWSLVLPRNPETGTSAEAYVRGFVPDLAHPLLRDLTLDGLVWTRATDFVLRGLPLISVGEHALLTESAVEGAVIFDFNLIAPRSTLALSPDWPILFSNLVAMRRTALPGPRAVNLVAGETFELRRAGRQRYELTTGGGDARSLFAENLLRIEDLAPAADYRLIEEQVDGEAAGDEWLFAVNFRDARESDLRSGEKLDLPPSSGGTGLTSDRYAESPASRILLLLLLGCVAGDWWVLRRRVTA